MEIPVNIETWAAVNGKSICDAFKACWKNVHGKDPDLLQNYRIETHYQQWRDNQTPVPPYVRVFLHQEERRTFVSPA